MESEIPKSCGNEDITKRTVYTISRRLVSAPHMLDLDTHTTCYNAAKDSSRFSQPFTILSHCLKDSLESGLTYALYNWCTSMSRIRPQQGHR